MPYTMVTYPYHSTAPVTTAPVPDNCSEASWASPLNPITDNDPIISTIEGLVGWTGYGFVPPRQNNEGRLPANTGNQVSSMTARGNTWDGTQHYNCLPPVTPPCSGTVTPSNTSNDTGYFSSAPMPVSSRQHPQVSHQPATSTQSPPQTFVVFPQSGSKKRKTITTTPKKQPKLRPSKSKPDTVASASEQQTEHHIGGQLLKSCQAQMDDIALSRLKVLGNESYAREVEMKRLADDVEALKEAATRNKRLLKEALEMAKRQG